MDDLGSCLSDVTSNSWLLVLHCQLLLLQEFTVSNAPTMTSNCCALCRLGSRVPQGCMQSMVQYYRMHHIIDARSTSQWPPFDAYSNQPECCIQRSVLGLQHVVVLRCALASCRLCTDCDMCHALYSRCKPHMTMVWSIS